MEVTRHTRNGSTCRIAVLPKGVAVRRHLRRSQKREQMRRELVTIAILMIALVVGYRIWVVSTWTAPLQYSSYWQAHPGLSAHAMSVIEEASKSAGVTPDRVVKTLKANPRLPDTPEKMEEYSVAKQAEFRRIGAIQKYMNWHPGVVTEARRLK